MKINKKHTSKYLLTILFSCIGFLSVAQEIKGYLYDLNSSSPLWNAQVKNKRTNESIQTGKDGSFKINGQVNDYLIVSNIGFLTDTIFYYESAIRRIYLSRDEKLIQLDEVVVRKLTDSRLAYEIEKAKNEGKVVDATQQKGGLRVSPSRLFSKSSKNARNNLALLENEQNNRKVDRYFTTQLIASITPLNQEEIALFKDKYRPTLQFIQQAAPEDLRIYILDSYKKFKNL